jgi:hypothetical protein
MTTYDYTPTHPPTYLPTRLPTYLTHLPYPSTCLVDVSNLLVPEIHQNNGHKRLLRKPFFPDRLKVRMHSRQPCN